eukprot:3937473-Rhodomonas_salina.1
MASLRLPVPGPLGLGTRGDRPTVRHARCLARGLHPLRLSWTQRAGRKLGVEALARQAEGLTHAPHRRASCSQSQHTAGTC